MLSRRTLLATSAALAVGCGRATPPVSDPVQLNVAAYLGFATIAPRGMGCPEDIYQDVLAALQRDTASPFGPTQGGYRLALQFIEEFFPAANWDTPPDVALNAVSTLLDELDADLVTVWPELAQWLGQRGLLLPLNQFSGAGDDNLEREFFPVALDPYRVDGALYALPVSVAPLMLYYHARHFRNRGVPPVDVSWDWEDLVENAAKLTTYRDDGNVRRWGLVAHDPEVWWALWQNGAEALDPDTLACRLQEPAAVEALQFIRDLMLTHRVSPPASGIELWEMTNISPPAMSYAYSHNRPDRVVFRMAVLPGGRESAVPVHDGYGIGIAARTPHTEAAFTALLGLVHALQAQANLPATRKGVAELKGFQIEFQPEELEAVERSLERGRAVPHALLPRIIMSVAVQSLVRGEDAATAVNKACATLEKYREGGELPTQIPLRPNPWRTCKSFR